MIAITADHHYHPYANFAHTDERGVNSRFAQMLAIETYLDEVFARHKVHTHLRLGDLFDRKNQIDAVVFAEVAAVLNRRVRNGIEEVLLKGNHDLAAGGLRNCLEALAGDGVHVIARPETRIFGERYSTRWTFLPYTERPAAMLEWLKTVEEHHGVDHAVLVGHCQINGARSGSEYLLPGPIELHALEAERFAAVFLGHVHEPQALDTNVFYVGSFCQRSFSDEGAQRRFVLFDEAAGTFTWHPLPGPLFKKVFISDLEELNAFIPDLETYYHVIVTNPKLKLKAIDAHFDGRCLGWMPNYTVSAQEATLVPRISSSSTTRWEDILGQYVALTPGPADATELLAVGRELLADVNS